MIGLRPKDLPAAAHGRIGPALAGDVDLVEAPGEELTVHFTVDAPGSPPDTRRLPVPT
jgi:hypothetical protein